MYDAISAHRNYDICALVSRLHRQGFDFGCVGRPGRLHHERLAEDGDHRSVKPTSKC